MEQQHKALLSSGHRLDMTEAIRFLMHQLACDDWYVACHHEHLYVVHLVQEGLKRYAICFEGLPTCEKGVYHGSVVCSVSAVPLGLEHDLSHEKLAEIRSGLIDLSRACHPA